MTPAHKVTLKELFQAAQQNEFQAVKDYLQIVLHSSDGNDSDSSTTATSRPPSKAYQRTAVAALVESKTRNTLLHYACDNGNLDACKYLLMLDGVAETFLNEPNAFGHTPLFYAASSGHLPLVKWLVSNGADIDTDFSDHRDVAPREGDHGVFTPLQIASFKGHADVVHFLVECNAELSGTRRNGKTPLHFACAQQHRNVVEILLSAGADVHACDDDGKTPVDVAPATMLALLLPDEHGGGSDDDDNDDNGLEAAADDDDDGDDDDDDSTTEGSERRRALASVTSAFGADIGRAFRSKAWRTRVSAIQDASLSFQSIANTRAAVKLFDGACAMMTIGLQDAVAQVVSSCCSALLKAAFNAVMTAPEFHTPHFHSERPAIRAIATALLSRGAGSNEKDASEAVAALLFLICKSAELTRFLTAQIAQIVVVAPVPAQALASSGRAADVAGSTASTVSWRHQLVAIKILNAITSQYRLDEAASGLGFADTLRISMVSLEHSSVHVRAAAIDLLVQCLLIRCEQSELTGTVDEMYEHMKSWSETLFRQQHQPLKPSIQAKINTGLRNALQGSKRLSAAAASATAAGATTSGGTAAVLPPHPRPNAAAAMFGELPTALPLSAKSAQKEDDLPYAEPIQEQHRETAADLVARFGEKVTRCLFSAAWAPRVEALSYLQAQVETRQLVLDTTRAGTAVLDAMQRALHMALQDRVNAVFEAGVALLMDVAIAVNASAAASTSADQPALEDFVRPLLPRLLVKLGDAKSRLHVTAEDALLLLARQPHAVGPECVLDEVIANDRRAAPQSLSAVYIANKLALVSKLLLEFGVIESSAGDRGVLPIRSVLQPALQVCEHRDPAVRLVALQIVADTLEVARSAVMPFLDGLARATRQKLIAKLVDRGVLEADLLMDEIDDFDVEPSSARPGTANSVRPPTASGSSTKHRPALSNASLSVAAQSTSAAMTHSSTAALTQPAALPYGTALTAEQKMQYARLIDALGDDLVRCLLDKTWAQREAAIRELERRVVCTASGRAPADSVVLLPKTLETLRVVAMALELGLNDTVARVFQCSLRLFQLVATELVPLVDSTDEYVNAVLETVVALVMHRLGDSKQRLRADCFTLLHVLAALHHIGYARMCRMLVDKFRQLGPAAASSPLLTGELLKLLTLLLMESHTQNQTPTQNQTFQRPDVSAILELIRPALENKHVDVRNAAIATYAAIYEVTAGGSDASYGAGLDLHGFVAQTKPAIREAITRSVVQITKSQTGVTDNDDNTVDSSRGSGAPEIDSARQPALALDVHRLTQVCGSATVGLLTSVSPALRCDGVDALINKFVAAPRDPRVRGAWEIGCLLVKQLLLDGTPSVCLAACELLELLADPPVDSSSSTGVTTAEYAIPWGDWGVHLVLGSTIRSVVQQTASESVRVRARVQTLLRVVAGRHAAGRSAVCNALLSAPEQSDVTGEPSKRVRKIAMTKLRWQLVARLELLYELLVTASSAGASASVGTGDVVAPAAGRRKSTTNRVGSTSSSATKHASTDALSVATVVPFLGSCTTHPSPSVRAASRPIVQLFEMTRADELARFVSDSCSTALQKRLRALLSSAGDVVSDNNSNSTADHFTADDATCVRGSRSSHVRRIAALRPPRSVPVEETKLAVDVFPPPHSAPGKSRRHASGDGSDDDAMNDGTYVVAHRSGRDESRSSRASTESSHHSQQQQPHPQSNVPIWLEQQGSRKSLLHGDDEPEAAAIGGGAAGLVKMRRKSSYRRSGSNNNNNGDDSSNATQRSSSLQSY